MLRSITAFLERNKMVRGMLSYSILWPCGCLIEQTLVEKRTLRNYDWLKCLKYSLFGGLFLGPGIYIWIRLAGTMWPRTDIKSSLSKALTEQLGYDPLAISSFLFTMSLLDGKGVKEAQREVSHKFLDAYKIGIIYWPCVQTFNFAFIPQRNQVVFTSFFSMLWTAFLAYMKSLNLPNVDVDHHVADICCSTFA